MNGSAPAAPISSARACRRVVPLTAWPRSTSTRASAPPRQPQPMIRQRASGSRAPLGALALPASAEVRFAGVHAGESTPLPWPPDMDLELTDEQRLIRETARDLGSDLTGLLLA